MPTPAHPESSRAADLATGMTFTLLAAVGFSAVSVLTTVALRHGLSLSTVLAWRYLLASLLLVAWIVVRPQGKRLSSADVLRWFVIGGGGQALLVYLALSSLAYISAATLGFLFYTYPAWVAMVQALRGAEEIDRARALALALSFGGVVLMVGAPGIDALAWRGIGLALGAALVYAVYIPAMQWMQRDLPVVSTTAWAKVGSAACFLALALADGTFVAHPAPEAWGAILALTVFSTVLPSLFFLLGLVRMGPVRTAIVSTVEPFMTAVLGVAVLAQPFTGSTLVGGALIVTAVILLQRASSGTRCEFGPDPLGSEGGVRRVVSNVCG